MTGRMKFQAMGNMLKMSHGYNSDIPTLTDTQLEEKRQKGEEWMRKFPESRYRDFYKRRLDAINKQIEYRKQLANDEQLLENAENALF